tara:strand:+ start:965 stop:2410 length:1446 start_codon:yes stop_codon:yes gene_type:complete
MSVTTIEQTPLYQTLVAGQEIIFALSNDPILISHTRVKFVIDVHISEGSPPVLSTGADKIATFKITPNNSGVGMIDLSSIIEDYVSADNLAADGSSFKGDTTTDILSHPMHLIDKYSFSKYSARYMALRITTEGIASGSNVVANVTGSGVSSVNYLITNGYLKDTDELQNRTTTAPANYFGFDMSGFFPTAGDSTIKFLTNAPDVQYANGDDYGTVAFLARTFTQSQAARKLILKYYSSGDVLLGSENIVRSAQNGSSFWGSNQGVDNTKNQFQYVGCFPGNLRNWSSTFKTKYDAGQMDGGKITLSLGSDGGGTVSTKTYTIHLNCPNQKGYESIRLCWLNQWGAWDYYTFTKKSTKKISTKGTTYDQLKGTWSSSYYKVGGYKGGKKAFRKNATESITMNTGFVTEDNNIMFEELTNSPEVYILKGFEQVPSNTDTLNRYVTPVTLKTSSFTRKTIANDRLLQYTFEIEKSRTLRTQSI